MQLKPEQLPHHLKNKGLAPIYCLSGDEPLQMLEAADLIRATAKAQGFEERVVMVVEKDFDWGRLREIGANLSLFAQRRLLELRLGDQKPGREGGAALTEYAQSPDPDAVLLLTMNKLEKQAQQSAWHGAIEAAGVTLRIWPVEAAGLSRWIIDRGRQYGLSISEEAAAYLADRIEGNLLAARQELEKLHLLLDKPGIDVEDLVSAVTDSARYDVFVMINEAFTGQAARCLRMLRGLRQEGAEPLAIHGALLWKLRQVVQIAAAETGGLNRGQAFSKYRIWQQHQKPIGATIDRLGSGRIARFLSEAHRIERVMKGAIRDDPWNQLENLVLRIAGLRLRPLLPGL